MAYKKLKSTDSNELEDLITNYRKDGWDLEGGVSICLEGNALPGAAKEVLFAQAISKNTQTVLPG